MPNVPCVNSLGWWSNSFGNVFLGVLWAPISHGLNATAHRIVVADHLNLFIATIIPFSEIKAVTN